MLDSLTKDGSGKNCAAKTWFSIASGIVLFKFLLSGVTAFGFDFGNFDSSGASMLIAAFGGVYWGRTRTKSVHGDVGNLLDGEEHEIDYSRE